MSDDDQEITDFYRKYFVNFISKNYGYNKKTVREILDALIFEAKDKFIENSNNKIILRGFGTIKLNFRGSQRATDLDGEEFVQPPQLRGDFDLSEQFAEKLNDEHSDILEKLDDGPFEGEE